MDFPQNTPKALVRFVKYWFTVLTKDPVRNIPVWTVQSSNQLYYSYELISNYNFLCGTTQTTVSVLQNENTNIA